MIVLDLFSMYQAVLDDEALNFNLCGGSPEKATGELHRNYSIEGLKKANSLDFNRADLRCAYLYRYSTAHSHMVLYALTRYWDFSSCTHLVALLDFVHSTGATFNVTSLGGGPGSDPVGLLAFLNRFNLVDLSSRIRVTVVDAYREWESPFRNIMTRFCGSILNSEFIVQNLLEPLRPEVTWNLRETHFLSMLKFLSAIAGNEEGTNQTLETIFDLLPANALVLVIDNSGGKAFKQARAVAKTHGLRPVFGPVCHIKFQVCKTLEPRIEEMRFGYRAQTSCNISIMVLQKMYVPMHAKDDTFRNLHIASSRNVLVHRSSAHPYRRQSFHIPGHHDAKWSTRCALPNREIVHPGLFPGAQAFAQDICNSFGSSNNSEPHPWLANYNDSAIPWGDFQRPPPIFPGSNNAQPLGNYNAVNPWGDFQRPPPFFPCPNINNYNGDNSIIPRREITLPRVFPDYQDFTEDNFDLNNNDNQQRSWDDNCSSSRNNWSHFPTQNGDSRKVLVPWNPLQDISNRPRLNRRYVV